MPRPASLSLAAALALMSAAVTAEESLEEVVVNARKRAEHAQEVPISLSEIRGAELQRRGLVRVEDIVRSMPNLSTDFLNPRQANLAIRGLGRNPANDALESSVGVFLDGVYLGRPGMMIADFVDLERIEVLRGPQGALFGKNATAGVVNILTASPAAEPEGWLEISAGDHATRDLRGAASGPIGASSFSYRASAFASARDGLVHDTERDQWLGELQRAGARAQLQWQPGLDTTLRLIADFARHDEGGPGYVLVDPNLYRVDGSLRPTNLMTRSARLGYTPTLEPGRRRNEADAVQHLGTDTGGATLLADWQLGEYRLSSITGWRKFSFEPEADGDFTALDVLPELGNNVRSRQFSEELRLASPADGKFQYLAGLHYFEQQVRSEVFAQYGSDASAYLFPGLPASALDGFRVLTDSDPATHSYSAFGQAYWWPRTDLEIAAGMRWTTEEKSATVQQHTVGGVMLAADDSAALLARRQLGSARSNSVQSDEEFVSGSLSVTWHVNEDFNAYLSASRGAKSGGVNAALLPPGADFTIDPETAQGYEAGIKTLWLDDRLQFNASAFHTAIEDYQASVRDPVVGATYLANAGEVHSTGAEAEAIFRPAPGLTLSGAVGYNDARYESFRNAACPPELDNQAICDFTGERVSGAAPLTLSGSLDYDTPLRDWPYRLRTLVEYSHSDGYRAELSRSTWIAARDLVNLRVSIRTLNDSRSLTLWVLNLFDESYYSGVAIVGPSGTGLTVGVLAPPRTLGLTLQFRY